jgi:hypothetical protein
MVSQILNRPDRSQQGGPRRPFFLDRCTAFTPVGEADAAWRALLLGLHAAHELLAATEAAASPTQPAEILVADPRGGRTPAQMVDQRVLAMLHGGHPGLFLQAAGSPQDIRRIPGDHRTPAPFPRAAGAAGA